MNHWINQFLINALLKLCIQKHLKKTNWHYQVKVTNCTKIKICMFIGQVISNSNGKVHFSKKQTDTKSLIQIYNVMIPIDKHII